MYAKLGPHNEIRHGNESGHFVLPHIFHVLSSKCGGSKVPASACIKALTNC